MTEAPVLADPAADPCETADPALDRAPLDAATRDRAVDLCDWILREAPRLEPGTLLAAFAERLIDLGVPVDRMTTAIEALHSEYSGVGRYWTREQGASVRLFPHGDDADRIYRASPFYEAHRTRSWLSLDLDATPEERFEVVPELKAEGYRHYLCVPILFTNGTENGITFATRSLSGFGPAAMAVLRFVMPAFAAVLEMRALDRRIDTVLRIYVGDEPHKAILSGAIRRGQVSRIRSAILFADMRGYTALSSALTPEATVELLNLYFDCLVPPIESEGGEVLKYMGDGLLAIFRDRGDDTGGAAQAALTAARGALARIDALNQTGACPVPIAAGIALHHGDAAYGNVGSGARLDFTVVGRDVNLASRIARLNKTLGEPLLMSHAFSEHLWGDPEPLGAHPLDGFSEPVRIYRPRT